MEKSKKILVVDDDSEFSDAIMGLLKLAKYDVVIASDRKEGIEKFYSEKPDLVLLDIMMDTPVDGFSLCHEMKTSRKDWEKNIPVIFVSATKEKTGSRHTFTGEQEGWRGPDDYLDKPIKPAELLECIEKHLEK
ncbi:response regulator transcription factor [Acidobacteriota bacterium]